MRKGGGGVVADVVPRLHSCRWWGVRSSAQRVGGHTVAQGPPLRPQHQRLRLRSTDIRKYQHMF